MIGRWIYVVLICVASVGAVLLIVGGILVPVFKHRIHASKQVGNTSFYFFNVSNPEEIVRTGKNTTVNQIGPYVYRMTLEMKHVSFAHSSLSYDLYKKYTFDAGMSVGNETDNITTINLPILNLATRLLWRANESVQKNISYFIGRMEEGLFVRISVSNLLWGYENKNLRNLSDFLYYAFDIKVINDSRYGLLYQAGQPRGKTFEGSFEVSTKADKIFDKWQIKTWNEHSSLDVWNSKMCNGINGTDGYAWPPGQNESQTAHIFDSNWCRSIDLLDTSSSESIDQLKSIRYEYSKGSFGYGGWRRGFCQPTPRGKKSSCLREGVLNVTKCKDNIPLLLSQPHFLDADGSYIAAIQGLNPDPKFHATYFKIDQASGEVVEGSRKLQLNAYVTNLTSFPDTKNFIENAIVIPIAWMEEVYSLTEDEKESLLRQRRFYDEVQFSLIGIGAVLLVFAVVALIVVVLLNRTRREGERQPLLGE